MNVGEKDVLYVAELANLELTPEERVRLARDLNSILEYVNRLNALETADVPPMIAVSGGDPGTALRLDEPRPSLEHAAAMQNAPDSDGVFFKVPKVIDK